MWPPPSILTSMSRFARVDKRLARKVLLVIAKCRSTVVASEVVADAYLSTPPAYHLRYAASIFWPPLREDDCASIAGLFDCYHTIR